MLNISDNSQVKPDRLALFNLGFRPFFLSAALFAVISMVVWALVYFSWAEIPLAGLSGQIWHGHEMIYGYAMAVVAGFLLTAVKNWTGRVTVEGPLLFVVFAFWVAARLSAFIDSPLAIYGMFLFDVLFVLSFCLALSIPLIQTRSWKHLGIVSKILLLGVTNVLFYLGALGSLENGISWGLYGGLYLILGLVFVMARRVLPFFIEKGVDRPVQLKNWFFLDMSSLVLFLIFSVADVFTDYSMFIAITAVLLAVLNTVRLWGWYDKQIWRKPMLWSLYVGYSFFVIGFILKALSYFMAISPFLGLHAFAYGGIALMTVGMMARVSLGHTGRNVFEPPGAVVWMFLLLLVGVICRVFLPIFDASLYLFWVAVSQIFWVSAFGLFALVYTPMFVAPRVDGRPG